MRPAGDPGLTPDVLTVFPTALKAGSVRRERARETGCLLGSSVTTFPELTDVLARDLGATPRVLEPEMAAVVLAHALDATGLPRAWRAPRRGLLRECLRVIAELKSAYLSPGDVAAVAAALPGPVGARLGELGRVYAAYEAALARLGAVDRHGREWLVCEGLADAEARGTRPRALDGVRRVVFAEIYDFPVLQFLIATSLVRLVGDAELVAFASPENVDATRFLDRTWNRFVGDPAIADQVLPAFVERRGRQGSIAAALRGVFASERPAPVPPDGSIRLVVAPSRYREVEAAVRDVRRRLEHGERPEGLALLARDLTAYGDLVEDVCRRYRVPVFFRKGRPLVANGYVRACLNVLRCVTEGFPRGRLLTMVDGDYVGRAHPAVAATLRDVGYVGARVVPFAGCVAARAAGLAADAADGARPPEERARALRRGATLARRAPLVEALLAELAALDAERTVAAHVRAFERCLRRLRLRAVPADDGAPPAARRDARAAERFHQTLALLAGVTRALGDAPLPLADFLRRLVAALEPQEVEDRAEAAGSVRALSILDARGLHFDAVYLLGLDDGTFPAPRAESPLWPDAMKRAANPVAAAVLREKLGARAEGLPLGGLLRTAREASLEDPFLFFLALSMAEREIVVSYPATNERGNPTVPSPFLDELRACSAGPLPETVLEPTEIVPPTADCCEPAELLARAALGRWGRGPGDPDRLGPALAAAEPALGGRQADVDRRAAVEERRSRFFLCPHGDAGKETLADGWTGRLGVDLAGLPERVAAMRWSPSRLETLGTCGFKFFARYVLGLGPDAEPEADVSRAERGTLVHAALAALFAAHPRLPPGREAARALAREFLVRWRAETARTILPKDPALLDVAWQQVVAAVDALVALEHEEAAARGEDVTVERLLEQPLVVRLDGAGDDGAVTLAGTPDRVDVERRAGRATRIRVLDYKMSRNATRYAKLVDPERALGRTGFQIPVYLLGALGSVTDVAPDAALEGGYHLLLAADRPWLWTALSREQLGGEIAARIRALVARARGGRFDVDPDPCDLDCAFRAVCRYQKPSLDEVLDAG